MGVKSEILLAPHVTGEMCTANYWLEGRQDSRTVLMTEEQIWWFNQICPEIPETRRNRLEDLSEWFDGTRLVWELAGFQWPEGLYLYGSPVGNAFYHAMAENIAGAAVWKWMPLRFGTAVRRTLIKSLPCTEFLSDGPGDTEWDQTAVCGVQVNEPLAIYLETGDGRFSYVKSRYCAGWAPSEDLAVFSSKAQWEDAMNPREFLMVTGGKVYLEPSADFPESSELSLSMGTALELCGGRDDMVSNRMPWNNYVVLLPCRDEAGRYFGRQALVPMNRDVHRGCLPMTLEAVLTLAFRQLGNRYGWGGMLNSRDCSSFVQELYRCFGLWLPRDTGWQAAMPVRKIPMAGMTEAEKGGILSGLKPGVILHFPGHEMLYLGERDGRYYTINDVSSLMGWKDGVETKLRVRSVIVNSLDIKRPNGKTWLSEIDLALIPWDTMDKETNYELQRRSAEAPWGAQGEN